MLQIDRLIACLQSSVNQQGLFADKKREGRCSGDYFSFTVCEIHFSGFIEALDLKGKLCTLKKVLRQPHNVLTLQVSLSLSDKQYSVYFVSLSRQKYRSLIYLQICEYLIFLVGFDNSSEFLSFFIEVNEEI